MKQNNYLKSFFKGLMMLAVGMPLAACVDNAYNLDDNVDLTLGFKAENLKLKIGNTEQVYLNDLLDIEESGVETDSKGMYYFVETGSTGFDFTIDPVNITVPRTNLTSGALVTTETLKNLFQDLLPNIPLPTLPALPVNGGKVLVGNTNVKDTQEFKTTFKVSGVSSDIDSLNYITPRDAKLVVKIEIETTDNLKDCVGLTKIHELSVSVPDFVDLDEANVGGNAKAAIKDGKLVIENLEELQSPTTITACEIPIKRVNIPDEMKDGLKTGKIEFGATIDMRADVELSTIKDFTLDLNQFMSAGIKVLVAINDAEAVQSSVEIENVNGIFNPSIGDVNINDIKIAEELPDFLQDEAVVIDVKNPTIRFNVDMRESGTSAGIPVSLDFTAQLNAIGGNNSEVNLQGELLNYTDNILYFHEGSGSPWSPNQLEEGQPGYKNYGIDGISALIKKVPEAIHIDINDKIKVKQEPYTIPLGETYSADINYDVYVPFEFNSELAIVYNDSACNISDDLGDEDINFAGAEITGSVLNTIPLELELELIPLGKQGNRLPMTIETSKISAGTGDVNEPVTTNLKLNVASNGVSINELDRIDVKVVAKADSRGGALCSNQWLQIKELTISVSGDIVYDANDYDDK